MYPPSVNAVTNSALVSTPPSSVSTETPSQRVPSFDHFVTQWMSTVDVSAGRLRNSSQRPPGGDRTGLVDDREVPVLQPRDRRRSRGQNREVLDDVLARRYEPGPGLPAPAPEASADIPTSTPPARRSAPLS